MTCQYEQEFLLRTSFVREIDLWDGDDCNTQEEVQGPKLFISYYELSSEMINFLRSLEEVVTLMSNIYKRR
jgi:hypothetical protein